MTPPMASDPYSDDMGPRTTSMRSIASNGGIQLWSVPVEPLVCVSRVLMRLLSTKIKV